MSAMPITTLSPVIDPQDMTLMDSLQNAWLAFRRLENAMDTQKERQRLQHLRDRLSDLMNELEGKQ